MVFERLDRLPPYILAAITNEMKEARRRGEDIINLGMGNPDLATPAHIVQKLQEEKHRWLKCQRICRRTSKCPHGNDLFQ